MRPGWLLPFAPRPCPGESFSSWLARVGCRYGFDPHALLNQLVPARPTRFPLTVSDWRVETRLTKCLAEAARCDESLLRRLDAARVRPRWPQDWFHWRGSGRSVWRDVDIFDTQLGQAWCPMCLREGHAAFGQDYLRIDWALACAGHCHRHASPLLDCCSRCGSGKILFTQDGKRTRLCCGSCWSLLAGSPAQGNSGPQRGAGARDVLIAFEADLMRALDGQALLRRWTGRSSGKALIAMVQHVANALAAEGGYHSRPLVEAFNIVDRERLERLPGIGNKFAALDPRWRRIMLAAVLSVIGDGDTCALHSVDLRLSGDPIMYQFQQWRGSMEWMVARLSDVDLLELLVERPAWPKAARERLTASAKAAGRTYPLQRAEAFARGELVRATPSPMPNIY